MSVQPSSLNLVNECFIDFFLLFSLDARVLCPHTRHTSCARQYIFFFIKISPDIYPHFFSFIIFHINFLLLSSRSGEQSSVQLYTYVEHSNVNVTVLESSCGKRRRFFISQWQAKWLKLDEISSFEGLLWLLSMKGRKFEGIFRLKNELILYRSTLDLCEMCCAQLVAIVLIIRMEESPSKRQFTFIRSCLPQKPRHDVCDVV